MDENILADKLLSIGLSHRQLDVVECVNQGLSNYEIGDELFISEKTVKFHLTAIYKILGVGSRTRLVIYCFAIFRIEMKKREKELKASLMFDGKLPRSLGQDSNA